MNDAVPFVETLFDSSSLNLPELPHSFTPDKQPENSDGEKFVVFFLDDELFAVAAGHVAEVVRPPGFTPLPNSPAWLHGIANLRGEIIPVLNLSKICGKKPASVSSKSKLIILKPENNASKTAFLIDRLSEIITVTPENIQPAEDLRFFGKAAHESGSVNLLDTERLFSSLL